MKKKEYKVGDYVTSTLTFKGGKKVKIKGKIKKITTSYGQKTYLLTEITTADFTTRKLL